MRRPDVPLFDRRMRADAASQDAWWHEYQAALFHRGLLRLRNPSRWLTVARAGICAHASTR